MDTYCGVHKEMEALTNPFSILPNDVLVLLLNLLDTESKFDARLVCTMFRRLIDLRLFTFKAKVPGYDPFMRVLRPDDWGFRISFDQLGVETLDHSLRAFCALSYTQPPRSRVTLIVGLRKHTFSGSTNRIMKIEGRNFLYIVADNGYSSKSVQRAAVPAEDAHRFHNVWPHGRHDWSTLSISRLRTHLEVFRWSGHTDLVWSSRGFFINKKIPWMSTITYGVSGLEYLSNSQPGVGTDATCTIDQPGLVDLLDYLIHRQTDRVHLIVENKKLIALDIQDGDGRYQLILYDADRVLTNKLG